MKSVDHLFKKAVDLHSSGQLAQAEKLYKKILGSHPGHPGVLHLLGLTAYQSGNYKSAIKAFEKSIAGFSNNPDVYNDCGEAYRALSQFDTAAGYYEKALKLNPYSAIAHNNLGIVLKYLCRLEEAVLHYQQAVSIQPDYVEARFNLACALQEQQLLQLALEEYKKILELKPDFIQACNNLGGIYLYLHQPDAAIECYQQAIKLMPDSPELHNNLGDAYQSLQRLDEAIVCYHQSLKLRPDFAASHNSLGTAYAEQGRYMEAVASYQKALSLNPDYAEALNNLGNACRDMGEPVQALEYFTQALQVKPDFAVVYRHMTAFDKDLLVPDIRHDIETLLNKPDTPEKDAMHLHFALGDLYDHEKSYDMAFNHYLQGNILKRKTLNFNIENHAAYIDRLIAIFTHAFFEEKGKLGNKSELPVFILGMPRSGTTLVDQIVSSHPMVHGAGELNDFLHIEQQLPKRLETTQSYPECIHQLDKEDMDEIAHNYLEHLRMNCDTSDVKYIIDKLPGNFLCIGLIKILFPNARIIHCKRNPLDTCISIYCIYFSGSHEYAYDLKELGKYYLEYQRLMDHWMNIFSPQIFEVQYEDIIADQEKVSRDLINYLGLEWDEKCLEFYKNKRPVQTASNLQIRKPIYVNSVNRWKNYAPWVEPLCAVLEKKLINP
jgi:tetratricopeptide (TPR) repeat protein